MINRDFDHLSTLLHLFFTRQDIQQKLNIIDQHNISGWEIWMQIEFANLLASTDTNGGARSAWSATNV